MPRPMPIPRNRSFRRKRARMRFADRGLCEHLSPPRRAWSDFFENWLVRRSHESRIRGSLPRPESRSWWSTATMPRESARRGICEHARDWFPYDDAPLRRRKAPRHRSTSARNTALSVAMPRADFVAITDDDVEPTPEWLAELLRVQKLYRADVVAGPSLPRFLEEPPAWIGGGALLREPASKNGNTRRNCGSPDNVLVRCDALERMDRPMRALGLNRVRRHGIFSTHVSRMGTRWSGPMTRVTL